MNTIDNGTLSNMIISMLERTAMVLAEPSEDEIDPASSSRFARIRYYGPSDGAVVLGASDGFLRELAAGLLGIEPAEVDLKTFGADALKEMANIIGGSVILALSGESCEYSLGLPEISESPKAFPEATAVPHTLCGVNAEGGLLWVSWHGKIAKAA